MATTTIAIATPAPEATPSSLTESSIQSADTTKSVETTKSDEKTTVGTYIFIGVLSLVLIALIYYAYNRFVENSVEEPFTDGVEQERDDPVVDFNLREAIADLNGMQQKVLSGLSENSEF